MQFFNKLINFWEVESFTVCAFNFSVQKEKKNLIFNWLIKFTLKCENFIKLMLITDICIGFGQDEIYFLHSGPLGATLCVHV